MQCRKIAFNCWFDFGWLRGLGSAAEMLVSIHSIIAYDIWLAMTCEAHQIRVRWTHFVVCILILVFFLFAMERSNEETACILIHHSHVLLSLHGILFCNLHAYVCGTLLFLPLASGCFVVVIFHLFPDETMKRTIQYNIRQDPKCHKLIAEMNERVFRPYTLFMRRSVRGVVWIYIVWWYMRDLSRDMLSFSIQYIYIYTEHHIGRCRIKREHHVAAYDECRASLNSYIVFCYSTHCL